MVLYTNPPQMDLSVTEPMITLEDQQVIYAGESRKCDFILYRVNHMTIFSMPFNLLLQ
jgi:hypothetical protein